MGACRKLADRYSADTQMIVSKLEEVRRNINNISGIIDSHYDPFSLNATIHLDNMYLFCGNIIRKREKVSGELIPIADEIDKKEEEREEALKALKQSNKDEQQSAQKYRDGN